MIYSNVLRCAPLGGTFIYCNQWGLLRNQGSNCTTAVRSIPPFWLFIGPALKKYTISGKVALQLCENGQQDSALHISFENISCFAVLVEKGFSVSLFSNLQTNSNGLPALSAGGYGHVDSSGAATHRFFVPSKHPGEFQTIRYKIVTISPLLWHYWAIQASFSRYHVPPGNLFLGGTKSVP